MKRAVKGRGGEARGEDRQQEGQGLAPRSNRTNSSNISDEHIMKQCPKVKAPATLPHNPACSATSWRQTLTIDTNVSHKCRRGKRELKTGCPQAGGPTFDHIFRVVYHLTHIKG